MGEGFVVMQSNDVDIYYYQDEPGMCLHAQVLTFVKQVDSIIETLLMTDGFSLGD